MFSSSWWKDWFKLIVEMIQRCNEYKSKFLPAIPEVANWIISRQFTTQGQASYGAVKAFDKALKEHHYHFLVHPQRANVGLLGLLRYTGEGVDVLAVAKRWIEWYLDHLDSTRPGIVYNHYYSSNGSGETTSFAADPTIPAPKVDPESQDDTAAPTFLSLCWAYKERGGDVGFLDGNRDKIREVAQVILDLQSIQDANKKTDGLTWTKPSYMVKALMDNSTVFQGLKAMARLEDVVFSVNSDHGKYVDAAGKVQKAIQDEIDPIPDCPKIWGLYDKVSGVYHRAKTYRGCLISPEYCNFYQNSMLLFPQLQHVIDPKGAIAKRQWEVVNQCRPDWMTSDDLAPSHQLFEYVAYAALEHGDCARAWTHTRFVIGRILPGLGSQLPVVADFSYPFTVDAAGWLLRTLLSIGQCLPWWCMPGLWWFPPEGFIPDWIQAPIPDIPVEEPPIPWPE